MEFLETRAGKTQFEMEVPTIDISSSDVMVTEASNYHLTRNKVKMKILPSQSKNYSCFECYALNMANGLQNSETKAIRYAISEKATMWLMGKFILQPFQVKMEKCKNMP